MADDPFIDKNEQDRLHALQSLRILDTPIEERFNRITRLAKRTFGVPICALSCIDQDRLWFKSIQGLDATEIDRSISFCQHTIKEKQYLVIPDAREDDRFKENPLITGEPSIVFYAGVPLFSPSGFPIASFCIIDNKPHKFEAQDLEILMEFAKLAERELHTLTPNQIEYRMIHELGESWRKSLIDPLTRLWNLEGINMILGEAIEHTKKSATGMCVALVDITDFEKINETIGQQQASKELKSFAMHTLQTIRKDDAIGRVHGDKFMIVMNALFFKEHAHSALTRLMEVVDAYQPDTPGCPKFEIATGAIMIPAGWQGSQELIFDQLEEVMFHAKQSANRWTIADADETGQSEAAA